MSFAKVTYEKPPLRSSLTMPKVDEPQLGAKSSQLPTWDKFYWRTIRTIWLYTIYKGNKHCLVFNTGRSTKLRRVTAQPFIGKRLLPPFLGVILKLILVTLNLTKLMYLRGTVCLSCTKTWIQFPQYPSKMLQSLNTPNKCEIPQSKGKGLIILTFPSTWEEGRIRERWTKPIKKLTGPSS